MHLSPENLSGDGLVPIAQVRRRRTKLEYQLKCLFGALGFSPTEEEIYQWQEKQKARKAGQVTTT